MSRRAPYGAKFLGKPCKICGNPLRYVSTGKCVDRPFAHGGATGAKIRYFRRHVQSIIGEAY